MGASVPDQALVNGAASVSALSGFDPSRVCTAFRVLAQRELRGEVFAEVGDVVFALRVYDYGAANDDTFYTGVKHISVTNRWDGDYPFFTIPRSDLELISGDEAIAAAQAIEARSDATGTGAAEGESAVRKDAPNPDHPSQGASA